MKSNSELKNIASTAINMEAHAIVEMAQRIDDEFVNTVETILNRKGRIVITGIGKSALIAQKIVATMNSTGSPALFMHAADAIHGDLGMIQPDDVVIAISKSGNTPEIKVLVPLLKQTGTPLIAMVGNTRSYLAEHADHILDTYVEKEACPLNLAPTTSTTAQLAMGDALAICLLESRSFTDRDFARYHPGGALGKRLYLRVGDLAEQNEKPVVQAYTPVKEVLVEITKNRLGAAAVLSEDKLVGVITDGDIRRMLEKQADITHLTARDIMGRTPLTVEKSTLAVQALDLLRKNNVSQLLVTDKGQYAGIIHLHDLLKEGII